MIIERMIENALQAFKEKLSDSCQDAPEGVLSVESARVITQGIQQALACAGRAAFKTYLESKEVEQESVAAWGQTFRFKYSSEKRFETLWGPMTVSRRVYQNAADTLTYVPLDAAWGMMGEFMTIEVREAVAFSCAHVTPEETHALLEKSALFHPHPRKVHLCEGPELTFGHVRVLLQPGPQIDWKSEQVEELHDPALNDAQVFRQRLDLVPKIAGIPAATLVQPFGYLDGVETQHIGLIGFKRETELAGKVLD
jgi:hypothetical protein